VGDRALHQVISGTAGADQGAVMTPRFGYLRVTVRGDQVERCFVEVPDPEEGSAGERRPDEPPMCP
jgi:hypothetical protein